MKRIVFLIFFLTVQYLKAQITLGAERFDAYLPLLQNQNVAFCGNHTSVVNNRHLVDILLEKDVRLIKIFCPEHGFRGEAEAGAAISNQTDAKTGIPIISLYGKNKKPSSEHLKNVDVIVFDIQDVGVRFYTYISTLHYVMEAAAENNVPVIVLDRPNPNGHYIDGCVLDTNFKSFVGIHPVPVVHGMTVGEYALMINGEKWFKNGVQCKLSVIPMEHYTHQTRYQLPIPPSPNLQAMQAIYLYPSLCFFEGTVISVGRGTDKPFMCYGHSQSPIGDYYFTPRSIKGVAENPPQNGLRCRGFDLSEVEPEARINLNYLISMYQNFPNQGEFFLKNNFFDKLAGNDVLRQQIINGLSESEIRASWQAGLEKYRTMRQKYLLYE